MKFKSILLTTVAIFSLTAVTMAQVPNYLPTNGLVGWWPFNGNANDESLNGNIGIVNGASLTIDRFGNSNKAYSFDGVDDFIDVGQNITFSNYTISLWVLLNSIPITFNSLVSKISTNFQNYELRINSGTGTFSHTWGDNSAWLGIGSLQTFPIAEWHQIVVSYNSNNIVTLYLDGIIVQNSTTTNYTDIQGFDTYFGARPNTQGISSTDFFHNGKLDDIGIWNRALTQQEITDIFSAVNCGNNTTITPQTNSITIGSTASFNVTTSDPNPSYIWQSNFGQGFQTLNNFGSYSGANSATLNIANVQLSEHNQPIRVISTSGNCIDTSNVALINILDTCITNVIVYDTLLTTVTDTLIINATITGLNPPSNQNTLKVFPNPANTHITINYGYFSSMSGYTLKIVNAIGQTVFTTPINQQTSYIDLSTWTGTGIYFVQLIDPQNNTIENRKIVIQ